MQRMRHVFAAPLPLVQPLLELWRVRTMKKHMLIVSLAVVSLGVGTAIFARDEHTSRAPKWPALAEFRGVEKSSVIAISQNGGRIAAILGNPVIIAAYRSGIPGN